MSEKERCSVKVLLFAASLRSESLNRKLTTLTESLVRKHGVSEIDHASMADFDSPSYNGDTEAKGIPSGAEKLRDKLLACDAFIISSPEYNASMPGLLKNVIDWTSRFRPQPFNGKQGFLMSASPSMVGGNRGLWSLRIPLEHLGARIYPDMYSLAQAHTAFGENGNLSNDTLQQRLESTLGCFLDLVEAAKHYREMKKHWIEFLGEHPNDATDREETSPTAVA